MSKCLGIDISDRTARVVFNLILLIVEHSIKYIQYYIMDQLKAYLKAYSEHNFYSVHLPNTIHRGYLLCHA
jgi:Fic family protein